MKVGFVGLGRMGRPMTENLLKKGFEVTIHNRSRGVVDELAGQGARAANSPAEVAQAADIVLTALPTVETVESVYLGDDGLIAAGRAGQILIDCSTVSPDTTRRCYEAAKVRRIGFLDGPMSGGPGGASGATLTFMIGGDAEVVGQARPVFEALGKNIHHVGQSGSGTVVKLVNQLLVGIHTSAASEALAFAVKAGANPRAVVEVIGSSFGGSAMLNRNGPLILQRKFDPATSVNLILKDLGLIHDVGRQIGARMLLTSLAEEVFKEARALGNGDRDMSATVLSLERLMDIEVVES
jgi:3-hydroxyisobutyrate dehydrogenase-like beta-hydroxyacid dehydrogenase